MKLNKIKILCCILPLLTSCGRDTFERTYKGFDFIVKTDSSGCGCNVNEGEGKYYPKNSLGIHINQTNKDYYVEYFTLQGYVTHTYRNDTWIAQGINVKFTSSNNTVYLSEGSYSLFEGDCPLH